MGMQQTVRWILTCDMMSCAFSHEFESVADAVTAGWLTGVLETDDMELSLRFTACSVDHVLPALAGLMKAGK